MSTGFEDFQKVGKDSVETALKSVDAFSKGFQQIAADTADYSRQSFEAGSAAFEQLIGAKSLDKAVEIQTAYFRSAYQDYVGQVTKVGEIVADMARTAYKPYEAAFGRFGK
ncbi:MAG: phasin family protein [Rhizobiales bacterium]|nr:phasin family protein [Hyphomicrobiales bacterium]MBN9010407.1 phasin family protein [Hyphomicrobiales bacterium]